MKMIEKEDWLGITIALLLLIALGISVFPGCVTTQKAREYAEYRYQQGRAQELQVCNEHYEKLYKSFQELEKTFEKFFETPANQDAITP